MHGFYEFEDCLFLLFLNSQKNSQIQVTVRHSSAMRALGLFSEVIRKCRFYSF